LLKPHNQRHIKVTSFGHSKSLYFLSVLLKYTNNFGSVFPNLLDCRIHETKFSTCVSFFCPLSICRATLTVPSTHRSFLLLVTVAMLSLHQSPLNCSSRKVEGNIT
jgi:hypothetical protein